MPTPGFYTTIGSESQLIGIQTLPWAAPAVLATALTIIQTQDFKTTTGRNTATEALNAIVFVQPFAVTGNQTVVTDPSDRRFGTSTNAGVANKMAIYINTAEGAWLQVLTGIRSALDISMRAANVTMLDNADAVSDKSASTPDPNQTQQRFNDASLAKAQGVKTAFALLAAGTGGLNYVDFETQYGLTWTAPA